MNDSEFCPAAQKYCTSKADADKFYTSLQLNANLTIAITL